MVHRPLLFIYRELQSPTGVYYLAGPLDAKLTQPLFNSISPHELLYKAHLFISFQKRWKSVLKRLGKQGKLGGNKPRRNLPNLAPGGAET